MNDRYVVVDIETTGHSVSKGDRIIQIGAAIIEGGEIVETFSSFVNPNTQIPIFIEELTGISDKEVENAPSFRELIPTILTLLEGKSFVAHNVDFDRSFLQKQLEHEGYSFPKIPSFDTVELARILMPKEESFKLTQLAEKLGFQHDRPHQADSDAYVTASLFLTLLHKLQSLPLLTLQQLAPMSRKFKSELEPLLENIIQQKVANGEDDSKRFDCYRNLALKKVVEDLDDENEALDNVYTYKEYAKQLFTKHGDMERAFERYELRVGQQQMMNEVDEAFQSNEHKLIEAGTGTGKSLAYLIPAAFYAWNNQEPVIISTQTIPLQEQLFTRDLPLLKKMVPFNIKVALLKGRSHYLCLRKFEQSLMDFAHDRYDVLITKAIILIWITETEYGDVEEINLPSGGRGYWYEIQSDAASDLGRFSPWFKRCFYHRARRRAQKSHLIITNHALLCTDLVQDQRLLPAYTHAVIDEAHHLEETASGHLGANVDYVTFSYLFQRLGLQKEEGMLERVFRLANEYQETVETGKIIDRLSALKEEIDEVFTMLHQYVLKNKKGSATDVGRIRYRFESYNENGEQWQAILECAMRVHMQTKDCLFMLRQIMKPFSDKKDRLTFRDQAFVADVLGMVELMSEQEDVLYSILLEYDPNVVYWIEIEPMGAKNATYLYCKPIDISDRLADTFFAKKKSVVLTSATLSINGNFDYQERRLGLRDFGVKKCMIASPFNYQEQVRLLLPTDLPAIKEVTEKEFAEEISIKLWRIADVSRGKMLVLFTSYEMLKSVYQHVKDFNEFGNLYLIGQGITSGSRAKLMKMFKQSEKAVLFGTSSFWEGIDLPGDELTTLVIVRLPFSPPDQPLLQAQLEKAKEDGMNPFMELSLPQAIIRFKQGFGRLIRTTHDQGCVFVLDRRISTTRYGKQFIRSLPDVPVYEGKLEQLLEQFNEYM